MSEPLDFTLPAPTFANHNITGYHHPREILTEELRDPNNNYDNTPKYLISFGGNITVRVYGDGLSFADAEDAAREFLDKQGLNDLGAATYMNNH